MKTEYLQKLNSTNRELREHISHLKSKKEGLELQLNRVTSARAYIFWQKANSMKRQILGLHILRQAIPFEWKFKIRSYLRKLKNEQEKKELDKYKKYLETDSNATVERQTVTERVSMIIPTKNAGPEFGVIMNKIAHQKFLSDLELIVVDSGSTDETLKISKKYGAQILKVEPEDFSHSKSRNLGARSASGKYIIFTVQDAHMLNEFTIYDAISFLKKNELSACSARQIPRSNADIFSSWQISNFVKLITPNRLDQVIDINKEDFDKLDGSGKRALCTIDDVFAIYGRDFFLSIGGYDGTLSYGEDLEMGKRLIEKGQRLGYMYSNGVVHSHERSASYFLRRYYVDTIFLYKVFNEKISGYVYGDSGVVEFVQNLYKLGRQLEEDSREPTFFKSILGEKTVAMNESDQKYDFDSVTLLDQMSKALGEKVEGSELYNSALKKELDAFVSHTLKDLDINWSLSDCNYHDLVVLTDKIFAIFASNHLARYYSYRGANIENISKMSTFLIGDV